MSGTSRRGADRASRQPVGMPSFVERLDAIDLATAAGFELPPVMIYGDDVTHVITEQGRSRCLVRRPVCAATQIPHVPVAASTT